MLSHIRALSELFAAREAKPLCLVRTFGCRQNVSDGEKIAGLLVSVGCIVTEDLNAADIIIYNTCAVRENAERRVYGLLGELKGLKDKKPGLIIGLCGCMAGEAKTVEKVKNSYKWVDLVFGTAAIEDMPRLLYGHIISKTPVYDATEREGIGEGLPVRRSSLFKADVPVMYGCDNFCSYCIVPFVRGRERSRGSDGIVTEVRELAAQGYKEITLLGQNVNSYGKGLSEDIDFPRLLRTLDAVDGDFKVRFMTSHPKDAGKSLIDAIADCDKICKHLHLPIQSGSDRILKEMNRGYTVEKYLETVDYARSLLPDFSFSTDIIVGFPNETREDFEQTLAVLKRVRFDNIYSFIFSKREGTKAANMPDSTSEEEKSARMREMLAVQRDIAEQNNRRFIGRVLDVLIEAQSKTEGFVTGKSDEFMNVEAKGDSDIIGKRVKVRITDARISLLKGDII